MSRHDSDSDCDEGEFLIVGLFVMFTLFRGSRKGRWPKHVRILSMTVGALFIAQVMIGAGTIWLNFSQEYRALHLAAGTAVWGGIALLTLLIFTPSPDSTSPYPNEEPAHA